jgi:GT2 family glycosyltransferase
MGLPTAIVILNWNGQPWLERFLPGVVACTGADAEVIVADNASTDGSIDWVRAHFPGLRIIRNAENLGFAGGYNEALKQLDASLYVLLNSDVEVLPGWVPARAWRPASRKC